MNWLSIFLAAFCMAGFIVVSQRLHNPFSGDSEIDKVQRFHVGSTPRVGGLAIWAGVLVAALWTDQADSTKDLWSTLLLCSLPVVIAGFVEDITKKISPAQRLLAAFISAALVWWVLKLGITRLGIPGVDTAMAWWPVSLLFTVFAVSGATHAFNIVDGLNGLASLFAVMVATSIALVGFAVGDVDIAWIALGVAIATLGFFFWNFPFGKLFLGDGGAYFLGFILAELAVLLVARNPQVSPFYAILVLSYPVVETGVSIWRRKVQRGVPAGLPDALHLHQLVYRRLVQFGFDPDRTLARTFRNSVTSVYIWVLALVSIVPATLFWESPAFLVLSIAMFIAAYLWLYSRLLTWRRPRVLVFRGLFRQAQESISSASAPARDSRS